VGIEDYYFISFRFEPALGDVIEVFWLLMVDSPRVIIFFNVVYLTLSLSLSSLILIKFLSLFEDI